jgi:hypothetical protein
MKSILLIAVTLLSLNAQAKMVWCGHNDAGPNFDYNNCSDGPQYQLRTADVLGRYMNISFYSTDESDAIISKVTATQAQNTNDLLKKISSLQVRTDKVEEALQQDVSIPESVKAEMKKEIIEELKKEFTLIPKN